MNKRLLAVLLGALGVLLLTSACRAAKPFLETFDAVGAWRVGPDVDAEGQIADGVYELYVKAPVGLNWTTAGHKFSDGIYQVEARQVAGPIDAGYGMMFRVDEGQEPDSGGSSDDAFYLFEISSDGYVWIGRCENGCADETILVNTYWFESDAVRQGLDVTNTLRVTAEGGNMVFQVNDVEVGRASDYALTQGDIGLLVETIGGGDVRVQFDNFAVLPLEK